MTIEIIPFEAESLLDWHELADAFVAGHRMPKAEIGDTFLYREPDTLLSRAAWIDGMGSAVKTATIFPENPADNLPMVNGGVTLYSDDHGTLEAMVDFHLVTKWKTAVDSFLGARLLARPDADCILIVGAGTVAHSLREAYGVLFPHARFQVWNRSPAGAEEMAAHFPDTLVASDLESAVMASDIITCATMTRAPLVMGEWLQPGQHLDLIGAYRPDMREADDEAMRRARIFMDSRATVLGHIGELKIPLEEGVVTPADVQGDFYDIDAGAFTRAPDDITLFKNGGGAHLDLMTARYILEKWRSR
ncbi:ornithine cyclodeaminase family protein [Sinisalibacter aestuarii]|uniref:Ornithine cyclodeaminase n=1 Tax=Sinisalibacter aestuarii TaxID=2949426 RepID=A0ABQ5LQC7_9RHOB|nr:ornithine cyclodeaminase [Sinisalibacter aestuarii]GKY86923.1 ornithine cyclodeaminase [Sinisalibacter aestuarii]